MKPQNASANFTSKDSKLEGDNAAFQWKSSSSQQMEFPKMYGVKYVRGAEVFGLVDEATETEKDNTHRTGSTIKLKLKLDPAQFYQDGKDGIDCYERFNLIVRRKPKSNNNKVCLHSLQFPQNQFYKLLEFVLVCVLISMKSIQVNQQNQPINQSLNCCSSNIIHQGRVGNNSRNHERAKFKRHNPFLDA